MVKKVSYVLFVGLCVLVVIYGFEVVVSFFEVVDLEFVECYVRVIGICFVDFEVNCNIVF